MYRIGAQLLIVQGGSLYFEMVFISMVVFKAGYSAYELLLTVIFHSRRQISPQGAGENADCGLSILRRCCSQQSQRGRLRMYW